MTVKITLAGDGLSYESEASLVQAAKIIGFLNTEEPLSTGYKSDSASGPTAFINATQSKSLSSPREAILNTKARTNAQKILVLGMYIAKRDNSDEFAASELKILFAKAGEPAPRNLSRDIGDAVKLGYIMESTTSSDMYVVTNTGRKAFDDGFDTVIVKKLRKKNGGKSTRKPTVPDWLQSISIDDQLEGFPSYRQLTTRSNRVLWILQWAASANRERVTGSEISAIADKLSDNIPIKQIAASFLPHLSNNRTSKTAEGYKILYSGSEFLKTLASQEG